MRQVKQKKVELKHTIRHYKHKVYMKCLQCTNYQPTEIILCPITKCILYDVRPVSKIGLYTLKEKLKKFEANN